MKIIVHEIYGKTLLVFGVLLLGIFLTAVALGMQKPLAIYLSNLVFAAMLLTFYGLTRIFRGITEQNKPRPWWRMTEKPALSFVFGIFFTVIGATNMFIGYLSWMPAQILAYAVALALGIVFLMSGVRLVKEKPYSLD